MDNNSSEQRFPRITGESSSSTTDSVKRITLASRTLDAKQNMDTKSFEEVSQFIDKFEKFVMKGFSDLRKTLNEFKTECDAKEESYNKQISITEDFKTEKESLKDRNNRLEEEVTEAKKRLKDSLKDNQDMIRKLSNMELKHKKYLESVATNYRERKIAKKVVEKWKHKLNGRSKVNLVRQENKYLRRELQSCQSDAKKAFLRSANTLNSEALSMFQSAANRRLSRKQHLEDRADDESFLSANSSSSASDAWSDRSRQNDNSDDRLSARERRPAGKRKGAGNDKENNSPYGSADDLGSEEDSRSYARFREACKAPKDKAESMKFLRKNVSLDPPCDVRDNCQPRQHPHVCRCQPLSARSEKCPKCPVRSFNFAHMPVTKKPMNSATQRNIAIATIRNKEKANVMYNPTGTAVVIEKHISY